MNFWNVLKRWIFPQNEENPIRQFTFIEGIAVSLYAVMIFNLIDLASQILYKLRWIEESSILFAKFEITLLSLGIVLLILQKRLRKKNLKNQIRKIIAKNETRTPS